MRGNGDRMVGEDGPAATRSARFARERLTPDALAWLRDLPATIAGEGWLACHGSPASDTDYLVEEVTPAGARPRTPEDIAIRLARIDSGVGLVLCGHTHLPRTVRLPDGRLVVNPGSVGLPAYDDEEPWPHRMETGSPEARYAIVERCAGAWRADLVAVAYDWGAAAAQARAAGWEDWARAVGTGRV